MYPFGRARTGADLSVYCHPTRGEVGRTRSGSGRPAGTLSLSPSCARRGRVPLPFGLPGCGGRRPGLASYIEPSVGAGSTLRCLPRCSRRHEFCSPVATRVKGVGVGSNLGLACAIAMRTYRCRSASDALEHAAVLVRDLLAGSFYDSLAVDAMNAIVLILTFLSLFSFRISSRICGVVGEVAVRQHVDQLRLRLERQPCSPGIGSDDCRAAPSCPGSRTPCRLFSGTASSSCLSSADEVVLGEEDDVERLDRLEPVDRLAQLLPQGVELVHHRARTSRTGRRPSSRCPRRP